MSAAPSIQPDPQDGMTPRMITMVVWVPGAMTDLATAEAAHGFAWQCLCCIGADTSSLRTDCSTLTPREDAFFRSQSEWKVTQ